MAPAEAKPDIQVYLFDRPILSIIDDIAMCAMPTREDEQHFINTQCSRIELKRKDRKRFITQLYGSPEFQRHKQARRGMKSEVKRERARNKIRMIVKNRASGCTRSRKLSPSSR